MNKYNIVPSLYKNKVSDDTNSQISIELESSRKELIEFDKNINIDLQRLYESEKTNSYKIRPVFSVNYVYNNVYSGTTSSKYKDELFYPLVSSLIIQPQNTQKGLLPPYEFDFFRPPTSTAFGYETISAYTYNWNYYLTYPYKNDAGKKLNILIDGNEIDWVAGDGLPFITKHNTINGFNVITITCGFYHNLNDGDSVLLKIDGVEKLYEVYSFGNTFYNSEKFIINILNINNEIKSNVFGTLKRVISRDNVSETTSNYYIRKHKILGDESNGIIVTKSGFQTGVFDKRVERGFYNDNFNSGKRGSNYSYNFTIQNEVNIEGITDNQNRPLTEIFLSIVFKGTSGFFAGRNQKMKQGWEFNVRNTKNWWYETNLLSNSEISSTSYFDKDKNEFFYYSHPTEFDGDFCEYNDYDQKERVVSDFYYKIKHYGSIFNVNDSDSVGYYYKPHNKMNLKVFSDYVETVSVNDATDIPNYAFYSKFDGQFRWRDIYSVGFFDENNNGVNYPFINNCFYPHANSTFKLFNEGYDYYEQKIMKSVNIEKASVVKPIIDGCE